MLILHEKDVLTGCIVDSSMYGFACHTYRMLHLIAWHR